MTAEFDDSDFQFLLKMGEAEAKETRRKTKSIADAAQRVLVREREME